MNKRLSRRIARYVFVSFLAAGLGLGGGTAGLSVAADSSASPKSGMWAEQQLNRDQINALRQASQAGTHLSVQQARHAIESAAGKHNLATSLFTLTAYAGYTSAQGNCSYMELYGYSDGSWRWFQSVNPPRSADLGEVSISTDGFAASVDDRWFSGPVQNLSGTLGWKGIAPSGTTMSGWMVLNDAYFCTGSLFARW